MLKKIPVPARLSLIYFLFSSLWISFSGDVAENLSRGDTRLLKSIEKYKGMFFVLVSTLLLFFVSRSIYRKVIRSLNDYKEMVSKNNAIVTATKEAIYEYDIKQDRIVFNDTMRQVFGLVNKHEVNARKFWEQRIHPDDRERVLFQFDNAQKKGIVSWREEYRAKTANGDYRNILHSVYILKDKDGKDYSVIGAIQDLTEFRKLQIDYHEQQLRQKTEIARSIITAEEKERNRWAEELHDNITQVLSVANLYTGMLKYPNCDIEETGSRIGEMIQLSVEEIRALSANLKPPRFQQQTLKEAIELLVGNLSQVKAIRIDVEIEDHSEKKLNDDQKLMVYRIVQEQLNNIIKYADASLVHISLTVRSSLAEIIIKDNGKGFLAEDLKEGTGFKNMRSRLELFDGQMEIVSAAGQGCEVIARFQR